VAVVTPLGSPFPYVSFAVSVTVMAEPETTVELLTDKVLSAREKAPGAMFMAVEQSVVSEPLEALR
jgi:hypothetical protein